MLRPRRYLVTTATFVLLFVALLLKASRLGSGSGPDLVGVAILAVTAGVVLIVLELRRRSKVNH